ncbi:MAG: hypothetical protein ACRCYO_01350 [Bacteroidia bacterium]
MSKKQQEEEYADVPKGVYHFSDNFSSVYFGTAPEHVLAENAQQDNSGLVKTLLETLNTEGKSADREAQDLKHAVLVKLRENKGEEILIHLLENESLDKHHRVLTMACWESGINFFGHLIFFVGLAIKSNVEVCLEAMTVIQEMRGHVDEKLKAQVIDLLTNALNREKGTIKASLLGDLKENIEKNRWPEAI